MVEKKNERNMPKKIVDKYKTIKLSIFTVKSKNHISYFSNPISNFRAR